MRYNQRVTTANQYAIDKMEIQKQRVYKDLDTRQPAYLDIVARRNYNWDFYFGRQYSQEELDKLKKQNRKPYIFNEIKPKVDHLIGSQTQTRMDVIIKGREVNDDAPALLMSEIMKYVDNAIDILDTETEVFKEAVMCGYFATVTYWQADTSKYGKPVTMKIPINELRWDGMARLNDFSDARWQARVMQVQRLTAMERYPEFIEEIENAGVSYIYTHQAGDFQFSNLKSSTQILNQNNNVSGYYEPDRELIDVIEHYEYKVRPEYWVINGVVGDIKKFDNKKEALDFHDGLIDQYEEDGFNLYDVQTGDFMVAFDVYSKKVIIQTLIIGDICVYSQETGLADFPFVIGTGYFDEGYAQGFVDNLIDPQTYYNDTMSTIDYMIGASAKGALTVLTPYLPKGWTIEDVRVELSNVSPIIPVISHGAIQPVQTQPITPELFRHRDVSREYMVTASGGQNALGLQNSASESGRAIEMRAAAGGTGRLPLFDSLKRWRKSVALRHIWWIKNYMSSEQIKRILGISNKTPYIDLDDTLLNTLDEISFDVVIDETQQNSTIRQYQFQQVQQMLVQAQLPPQVTIPTLLEYSDLSESAKSKILTMLQVQEQDLQQKAQAAELQKMQTEVHAELKKRELKAQLQSQGQYLTEQDMRKVANQKQKDEQLVAEQMAEQLTSEQLNSLIGGQPPPPIS